MESDCFTVPGCSELSSGLCSLELLYRQDHLTSGKRVGKVMPNLLSHEQNSFSEAKFLSLIFDGKSLRFNSCTSVLQLLADVRGSVCRD